MSWTWISDTTPKARKHYQCYLCALEIAKGQIHVARRGILEGEGRITQRMHVDCEQVSRNWRDDDWETDVDPQAFRLEKAEFFAREDKK